MQRHSGICRKGVMEQGFIDIFVVKASKISEVKVVIAIGIVPPVAL
jgi:hypothetical protein